MFLDFKEQLIDTCPQCGVRQGMHTVLVSPALQMSVTKLSGESLLKGAK